MTRIITVTSGKSGVGKTSLSVNLALQFAKFGYSTCLFDADLGLANVNNLLNIKPERTLQHLLDQRYSLDEIILHNQQGIDVIPASSGLSKLADLEPSDMRRLANSLDQIDEYDYFILDTAASVSRNVLSFALASPEILLVITPEPTSLTDAYALVKILQMNGYNGAIKVVVNQCKTQALGKQTFEKFNEVVHSYLDIIIDLAGTVLQDDKVSESIKLRKPLIYQFPESRAARSITHLCNQLIAVPPKKHQAITSKYFWEHFLNLLKSPLSVIDKSEKHKEPVSKKPHTFITKEPVTSSDYVLNAQQHALEKITPVVNNLVKEVDRMRLELASLRENQKSIPSTPPIATKILKIDTKDFYQLIGQIFLQFFIQDQIDSLNKIQKEEILIQRIIDIPLNPGYYTKINIPCQSIHTDLQIVLDALLEPNISQVAGYETDRIILQNKEKDACIIIKLEQNEITGLLLYTLNHYEEMINSLTSSNAKEINKNTRMNNLLNKFQYNTAHVIHGDEPIDLYHVKQKSGNTVTCAYNGEAEKDKINDKIEKSKSHNN